MNYRLNFILMLLLFSAVTLMVCMAYENMEDMNVQTRFQEIGLLQGYEPSVLMPPRKPDHLVANLQTSIE